MIRNHFGAKLEVNMFMPVIWWLFVINSKNLLCLAFDR